MRTYVVMERGEPHGKGPDTVFVRDAFAVLAWIFPLIWVVWYRLWFPAILMAIVTMALMLLEELRTPPLSMTIVNLLIGAFVALEGPVWRVAKLRSKGYVESGSVQASSLDEAEIRWFHRAKALILPVATTAEGTATFGRPATAHAEGSDIFFGYTEPMER